MIPKKDKRCPAVDKSMETISRKEKERDQNEPSNVDPQSTETRNEIENRHEEEGRDGLGSAVKKQRKQWKTKSNGAMVAFSKWFQIREDNVTTENKNGSRFPDPSRSDEKGKRLGQGPILGIGQPCSSHGFQDERVAGPTNEICSEPLADCQTKFQNEASNNVGPPASENSAVHSQIVLPYPFGVKNEIVIQPFDYRIELTTQPLPDGAEKGSINQTIEIQSCSSHQGSEQCVQINEGVINTFYPDERDQEDQLPEGAAKGSTNQMLEVHSCSSHQGREHTVQISEGVINTFHADESEQEDQLPEGAKKGSSNQMIEIQSCSLLLGREDFVQTNERAIDACYPDERDQDDQLPEGAEKGSTNQMIEVQSCSSHQRREHGVQISEAVINVFHPDDSNQEDRLHEGAETGSTNQTVEVQSCSSHPGREHDVQIIEGVTNTFHPNDSNQEDRLPEGAEKGSTDQTIEVQICSSLLGREHCVQINEGATDRFHPDESNQEDQVPEGAEKGFIDQTIEVEICSSPTGREQYVQINEAVINIFHPDDSNQEDSLPKGAETGSTNQTVEVQSCSSHQGREHDVQNNEGVINRFHPDESNQEDRPPVGAEKGSTNQTIEVQICSSLLGREYDVQINEGAIDSYNPDERNQEEDAVRSLLGEGEATEERNRTNGHCLIGDACLHGMHHLSALTDSMSAVWPFAKPSACEHCKQPFHFMDSKIWKDVASSRCKLKGHFHPDCFKARKHVRKELFKSLHYIKLAGEWKKIQNTNDVSMVNSRGKEDRAFPYQNRIDPIVAIPCRGGKTKMGTSWPFEARVNGEKLKNSISGKLCDSARKLVWRRFKKEKHLLDQHEGRRTTTT